jgi:hypothetical protein
MHPPHIVRGTCVYSRWWNQEPRNVGFLVSNGLRLARARSFKLQARDRVLLPPSSCLHNSLPQSRKSHAPSSRVLALTTEATRFCSRLSLHSCVFKVHQNKCTCAPLRLPLPLPLRPGIIHVCDPRGPGICRHPFGSRRRDADPHPHAQVDSTTRTPIPAHAHIHNLGTVSQAKLGERTQELDAAKARTALMEEHIETCQAGRSCGPSRYSCGVCDCLVTRLRRV